MTDWLHGEGEMARRIRAYDWSATPLGPIAQWPQSCRTAVGLMLASGHAMQLAWGPDMTVLYNDAYAPMLGDRHPQALGIPFREAWPDIWDEIAPLVQRVFAGETVKFEDMPLVMTRRGYPEDTWWNFSYSPVRDESGAIAALLNVTVDTTANHRAEEAERARDEAEETQRLMLQLVPALPWWADASGHIVTIGEQWKNYKSGGESGAQDFAWLDALHPDDVTDTRAAFAHAFASGEPLERQQRIRGAGGDYRWHLLRHVPLRDEHGVVQRWFGAAVDVHSLHMLEERQAFLLRFSDALRPVSEPEQIKAVATRLLGEHLGVNRAFYADAEQGQWIVSPGFERDIEALPARPFDMTQYGDWIIDGFRAGDRLVVHDTATDPRFDPAQRDAHLALQIGAEVVLPLLKGGKLVAMLVVHTRAPRAWQAADLALLEEAAERTWAAVERARAELALHRADRRKDEFLAVLAHELRNGLAPLVYNGEIGNRSLGDAALLRELFARNHRQLQHLGHLVNDLLDVARISTGKIVLSLERVQLREVVKLALDACRADIDRKRHKLAVIDESNAELAVQGDRVRLTQVVSNLLSNASKYMRSGGTITLRIARQGNEALVEVSDTGIGIPTAALPQVFDLFSQVRNQQAYSEGGLGIGLSLVKQLVEMHGGSVDAASEGAGHGSRFVVRLPLAAAQDAGVDPGTAPGGTAAQRRALRVLVVDDHRDAADSLAQLLCLQGYEAEAAYDGEQALDRTRRRRPDLVLLDLGMPGMDGFQVARHLREDFPAEPTLLIVALTGWAQESDREQTRAASFDDHLAKPPSDEALQELLSAACRQIA